MKTIEECKNEVASNNNFDSFKRAVRYTFNRELLQSEEEFLDKIINESMQLFAEQQQETRPHETIVIGENLGKEIERRANDLGWTKKKYAEMIVHSWLIAHEREDGTMFKESQ